MNVFYTIFKNSVRTSQETQCISITVPYLVLFTEIIFVHSKNHTKALIQSVDTMQRFLVLTTVVHIVTTVLQRVYKYFYIPCLGLHVSMKD
jgi:L-lactate permease